MAILKFPVLFVGAKGEKTMDALFDSGASLSCIHPDQIEELAEPQFLGRTRKVETASEGHFIEVKYHVALEFYINDVLLSDEFLMVPGLSEDVIIGAATMQKWRIKLNFEEDKVEVDPRAAKLKLI